jgi:hypothetical protein
VRHTCARPHTRDRFGWRSRRTNDLLILCSPRAPHLTLSPTPRSVDAVEKWAGAPLLSSPSPPSPTIVPLRLNLDDLRAQHRPILHYVVTHLCANLAGWAIFRARGFERRVKNGQVRERAAGPSEASARERSERTGAKRAHTSEASARERSERTGAKRAHGSEASAHE